MRSSTNGRTADDVRPSRQVAARDRVRWYNREATTIGRPRLRSPATASPHVDGRRREIRAAWSRCAGDVSTAVNAISWQRAPTDADDHVPRSLVRLAPMSVLRAGRKRAFRAAEFVNPSCAARSSTATARGRGAPHSPSWCKRATSPGTGSRLPSARQPVERAEAPAKPAAPAAMPSPIASEETSPSRRPWIVVLLLLGIALAMWTRRPSAVRR